MNALLMIISVLLVGIGGLSLSVATSGVGMICIGIAFAVWCLVNQAAEHRREDMRERERQEALKRRVSEAPTLTNSAD